MGYKFNPFTGNLDEVGAGGGGGTPGGSDTQIQFNDAGSFGGDVDLTWNKTTNVMTVAGDVNLSDGGSFTTTLQTITPTANRTVSIPDATGTLALVAGSSGQPVYNNAGAYAGLNTATIGTTGNITLSLNGAASTPPVSFTGTWFTGGTGTTTKPQLLIEPSGTTSTAWSTSGTGLGVNAASGFAGRLLDLQINGTSLYRFDSTYGLQVPTTGVLSAGTNTIAQWSSSVGFNVTSLRLDISNQDVVLTRDAAGTLAQRNGGTSSVPVPQTSRIYNYYASATDYERGKLEWSGNVFRIGTEAGSGGGTARALELQTNGTTRVTIGATSGHLTGSNDVYCGSSAFIGCNQRSILSSPADGVMRISNYAVNDFNRLQFGGTTSSFPALKRSSAVLETKLADDSAYAQHAASVFQAATAHTVATLPATPVVGMIARVTDATAPAVGATVTGGGSAAALCWYNGTNWTVIGV